MPPSPTPEHLLKVLLPTLKSMTAKVSTRAKAKADVIPAITAASEKIAARARAAASTPDRRINQSMGRTGQWLVLQRSWYDSYGFRNRNYAGQSL
jgi:hypothetical protein